MKTIIENGTNCSKYLVADDYSVVVSAENIEMGDPSNLDFIIGDLNSTNSTVIEGVTTPDDWYGCRYNHVGNAWELVPDWIDPRLEVEEAA